MDVPEEDEDVIIEGSELHRALVDMGYTDFESTRINKNFTPNESFGRKWYRTINNFFKFWSPLNGIFNTTPKACSLSSKQLAIILRVECLLDDHAAVVQSIMEKNGQSYSNKFVERLTLVTTSAIFGFGYFVQRRKNSLTMFLASSIAAFAVYRRYNEFLAVKALSDVVTVENELYRLYKKGLRILRKVYRLRIDGKKPNTEFSKLEITRLKYLQPVMDTLLKSMESVSRIYYQASSMIIALLPKNTLLNDTLTYFEIDAFAINGEITYDKLRHLYYVYILVQSDTMQLLAIAYDADTWMNDGGIPHSLLTRIITNLCRSLTNYKDHMTRIVVDYESCKRRTIDRRFRVASASKWRDLYLNLDLLSRKLQMTYDDIMSILEEIDKRGDHESMEDSFVTEITERIHDIYTNIDKARNFAEFNNLLMVILQRSRPAEGNPISEVPVFVPEIEGDERSIVRDSEPLIIDEVFEEYITEEYLKPLNEFNDVTLESDKLDKLLAQNFMSELKEALIDKCKSMSDREATALLRKYGETNESLKSMENIASEVPLILNGEKSIIPCPPPLPGKKQECRGPVPLPRASAIIQNFGNNFPECVANRIHVPIPPPPPPPPPPLPLEPSKIESCRNTERLPIDLPKIGPRKIPAFVTSAEEFIGSGENSEEESDNDDLHRDESFIHVTTD